jgi:hypothetical protein
MAFSPRRVVARAAQPFYRHRVYRWSWSPIDHPAPGKSLPEGFALTRATAEDLPLLEQMGADFDRAREFLAAGHALWLVRDGSRVAFSAWTFMGAAPTDAPRTGWMLLPEGTVNQEDSNTHVDFRGQGLAGVASQAIHAELLRSGEATRLITAILDSNTASRRAASKTSWREFAVVDVKKFGLLRRDADWRGRRADGALVATRLGFSRPDVEGGPSADDEELFAWLQTAMRHGVPGPAVAAEAPVLVGAAS